jgi:hypothetical protein
MADQVRVELVADTSKATASIDKFAKAATSSLESVESAVGFLKNLEIAKLALEGFAKLNELMKEAIKEASEADTSFARLNIALAANGENTAGAADQIQKTTTYSDDQALSLISLAKSYGVANKDIDKLVIASTNLAAATGQTLESAFLQLNGTLEGNVGLLGRRFHTLDLMTKQELKAGGAVEFLSKRFDGAAQVLAGTYDGATKQAENSQRDLFKEIGKIITQSPVFIKRIQQSSESFSSLADTVKENSVEIRDFAENSLIFMVDALENAIGALQFTIKLLGGLAATAPSVGAGLANIVANLLEFANIPELIDVIINKLVNLGKAVVDTLRAFVGFTTVGDQLKETGSIFGNFLKSIGVSTEAISNGLGKVNEVLTTVDDANLGSAVVKGLRVVQKEADDTGQALYDNFAKAADSLDGLKDSVHEAGQELRDVSRDGEAAGGATTKAAERAKSAWENFLKTLQDARKAIKDNIDIAKELGKGIQITVDVAALKKNIADFAASIPVTLQAIQAKNQATIDAMFAKIPAALDKVRQAAEKEGQEKLKALSTARAAELTTVKQKAAEELKASLSSLDEQLKRGEISQSDLVSQKAALEASAAADLAKQEAAFQLETDKKLADQQEANAIASAQKVAEEEKRLQDEIAAFKLKVEDDIANKRLELEDELAKKRAEADRASQEAAAKILGQVTGFLVDKFIPGLGSVVDGVIVGFAKAGSFIRDAITSIAGALPAVLASIGDAFIGLLLGIADFVGQIPTIVLKIVEGIPAFIQKFAEAAPQFINALAVLMPIVADGLIVSLIANGPRLYVSIVKAITQGLINGIIGAFEAIVNGFVKILNSIPFVHVDEVKLPRVTLASGGTVPQGFSRDNFPASLQSGEMVVPRDDTEMLRQFLADQASPDGGNTATVIGQQIKDLVRSMDRSSEKNVTVNVVVSERVLARAMVNIDRQGLRTTA